MEYWNGGVLEGWSLKCERNELICGLDVVSRPSIRLKVKADRGGQPQEYREYFEDWTSRSNAEIEPEGRR
jgi:hypothetical protein